MSIWRPCCGLPTGFSAHACRLARHGSRCAADLIVKDKLSAEYIIPRAFDLGAGKAVFEAVTEAARRAGVNEFTPILIKGIYL